MSGRRGYDPSCPRCVVGLGLCVRRCVCVEASPSCSPFLILVRVVVMLRLSPGCVPGG